MRFRDGIFEAHHRGRSAYLWYRPESLELPSELSQSAFQAMTDNTLPLSNEAIAGLPQLFKRVVDEVKDDGLCQQLVIHLFRWTAVMALDAQQLPFRDRKALSNWLSDKNRIKKGSFDLSAAGGTACSRESGRLLSMLSPNQRERVSQFLSSRPDIKSIFMGRAE